MATTKMIAPVSFAGQLNTQFGTYTPDALGQVAVDSSLVASLMAAGWTVAGAQAVLASEGAESGLTAHAGGTQAAALALSAEATIHQVATVASAADSVKLPAANAGEIHVLINSGANPMQVFGSGTDTINGVATATGISQMQNSVVIYHCYAAGLWIADDIGIGFSGSLPTESAVNGVTANPGGGQGSAVLLTAAMNRVTTVGTAADSVKLQPAAVGLSQTVINAAASNSMNVFPSTGDAINALGANAAFAVAAGKTATFYCCNAGQWH